MMPDTYAQSVGLFFKTFSRHLEKIRDEGGDAQQAYRAQILLGQLVQFEKAVAEVAAQVPQSNAAGSGLESLLTARDLNALATWLLEGQTLTRVRAVLFWDQDGVWRLLAGEAALPRNPRIGEWVERGLIGRMVEAPGFYLAYLYGQPRMVLAFASHDEADLRTQELIATFAARFLPLLVTTRVKLPDESGKMPSNIITRDPKMLDLLNLVRSAATKDVSILLEGESGTGKEVVANFIHANSSRSAKKLVVVNCAAIPAGLIESELFGHEKGAFTGAYQRQIGRVEQAAGGTLFLDEIGEMELAMQAKLLRFLQLHEFHRVGGKQKISVDVRIVAATNRNLRKRVAEGAFREDLYYRLSVMPFVVPPLRERIDDILPLTRFFLEKYAKVFGQAVPEVDVMVYQYLAGYDFPGNVRELENIVQHLLVVSLDRKITPTHLPPAIQRLKPEGSALLIEQVSLRSWRCHRRSFRFYSMRLGTKRASIKTGTPDLPEQPTNPLEQKKIPANNKELKKMKQEIQDQAARLTLELEHRFLNDLLRRADGSMPQASVLGQINRTLLYKIMDRTKHLDNSDP